MKNILLPLHDDAGQEARLQAGLDLARALQAHLTCLDLVASPELVCDVFGDTSAFAILLRDAEERESRNCERLKERLAREDVSWSLSGLRGRPADCIQQACGLADIIIVNSHVADPTAKTISELVHEIVTACDQPLLAVPDTSIGIDFAGKTLVAWDGSEPSMAALTAAVPILKLATDVRVISVDSGEGFADAQEAATYLSRHNIHADVAYIPGTHGMADEEILADCANYGAALCVMGAYGHSRFRERLFGGVTRRMLAQAQLPLFLAR